MKTAKNEFWPRFHDFSPAYGHLVSFAVIRLQFVARVFKKFPQKVVLLIVTLAPAVDSKQDHENLITFPIVMLSRLGTQYYFNSRDGTYSIPLNKILHVFLRKKFQSKLNLTFDFSAFEIGNLCNLSPLGLVFYGQDLYGARVHGSLIAAPFLGLGRVNHAMKACTMYLGCWICKHINYTSLLISFS